MFSLGGPLSTLTDSKNMTVSSVYKLTHNEIILLNKFPLEQYASLLESCLPLPGYHRLSADIYRWMEKIEKVSSKEFLCKYNRCIVSYLCDKNINLNFLSDEYPVKIVEQFSKEYQRICSELITNKLSFYDYKNDLFCKDLGICTGRMFPVGPLKVEKISGIPRSLFLRSGIIGFCNLIKLRGFVPYVEPHLDIRFVEQFNHEGWEKALKLTSIYILNHSKILGMIGASWFFDPEAIKISPKLSCFREVVENNGGMFFKYRSDIKTTNFAISRSRTRRKLYETKVYKPISYMFVWPRSEIINWIERDGTKN